MSRPLQLQGPEDVDSLWIAVTMNRGPLRIIYEQLRFRGIVRYREVVVVYPLPKFPRSLIVLDVPRDVVLFSRSRCVFVESYRSKPSSDGVRPASRGELLRRPSAWRDFVTAKSDETDLPSGIAPSPDDGHRGGARREHSKTLAHAADT